MEFCRAKTCPFEDCPHNPHHAPHGFAYTSLPMDEDCTRYKEHLAAEAAKAERIRTMTTGTAYRIFNAIEDEDVSNEEKAAAIYKIINMETHNSVTKAMMLKVIRWLLELSFDIYEGDD